MIKISPDRLLIRDKDGNLVPLTAIKGDKGDDYIITPEDIGEIVEDVTENMQPVLESKQNKLTPGDHIHIEGDTISADMYDDTKVREAISSTNAGLTQHQTEIDGLDTRVSRIEEGGGEVGIDLVATISCDFDESIGMFKFLSVAQTNDDGETVDANVPVYSNFGYQGKKGIRITDSSIKEALFLDVRDNDFSKFGCGVLFRPLQNGMDYDSNGMYVFHGYKDANNNIELKYRPSLKKFTLSYKVGGSVFDAYFAAPWNDVLEFKTGELIGLYLHFVSDRFVNIYLMYKGNVSINTVYIPNLTPIAFNTFALGMRYRGAVTGQLGSNATYQANCIFANFKLEFGNDIRPIKYFEGVM